MLSLFDQLQVLRRLPIAAPTDGQALLYNSATKQYEPTSLPAPVDVAAALAAFVGTTNIVTLGTITTGTWHGTPIAKEYGGTGLTSSVNSAVLATNGAGTPAWATTLPAVSGASLTGITASQVGALAIASNLSDLASATTARTNLGLGSAATKQADNSAGNTVLLDGSGLLPTSVLPPLSVNKTDVVASQAAMLTLTSERGDIAIRTDTSKTYVLSSDSPGTLADWKEIVAAGAVTTVNGYTGTVVLTKTDIGLALVENSALSTWGGSANLTTLGTIGTGIWSGTAIGVTKGGTGLTGLTANRITYATATDTLGTSAGLTFDGTTLTATTFTGSGTNASTFAGPLSVSSTSASTFGGIVQSNGKFAKSGAALTGTMDFQDSAGNVRGKVDMVGGAFISAGGGFYVNTAASNTGFLSTGLYLDSATALIKWTSGAFGGVDTGISRSAAGVVQINNGTLGTLRDLTARAGDFTTGVTAARVTAAVVALTDAATIATDASLGNTFRVTLGGNRTLGNPTNPVNGQTCTWELIQDGIGTRTLALDTKFALGTDITSTTLTTTLNKRDFLVAKYNSTADKWYVIGFIKGY